MIQLRKILQEQGTKKWPPTGLDEKGATAFIRWMQRNRTSAYEAIGLSVDLAKDPEHPRIREAYAKFGTAWFKTDPDAKYEADPEANDGPRDGDADSGEISWWMWLLLIILGAGLGFSLLSRFNKTLGWIAGTESGRLISTSMFRTYKTTALKQKQSLLTYLENISKKQDIFIKNKQGDLIKLSEQEKREIEKALKNPTFRKLVQNETAEWGIQQLKKGAITADELAIMVGVGAEDDLYRAFKRIEQDTKKSFSKVAPKRIKTVSATRVNPASKTGKMLNSDIAPEKLVYKKEHDISLTQFDQAAKGQISAADMTKTYNAIAPKGKLNTNMPTSILRLKTFPTIDSWKKHYQNAKIPVPTAKDAYIKDKIKYNFLRQ